MIEEIRIRGLGVIDDAELDFAPGLTVVTGETGAGKTMVVTGLGLLLGARADSAQVRVGADRASVEGRFLVDQANPAVDRVAAVGGELDDGCVIVRRTVSSTGRSRAHVGGAGAPVSVLAELAESLVAVHGQSEQHRLLQPAEQRHLLDAYAGNQELLAEYRAELSRVRGARRRLADLVAERQSRLREAEELRFGLAEIAAVDPQAGEDVELLAEESRLAHADELHAAAMTARAALDRDDEVNVTVLVGQGRQALEAMREHDPALAAMADRLAEIGYLATDLAVELVSYAENVEADPYRLAAVSERRAQLGRLMGRYGSTVDEVLSWSTTAHDRLLSLELTDDQVEALSDEVSSGREALTTLGRRLSQARHQAANELSSTVTSELADLAMPDASFQCSVVPEWDPADDATFGDDGIDDVTFRLRPHPDAPTLPLAKGASGGELSRVMLAIEVCLASVDTVPTFVFDEVDAGVGGQAAVEVGRRLAVLARESQVIVVTHLPQVAAFADQHLVVTKSRDGVVTRSDVTSLDQGSRSKELARMLAGLPDSAHGQKHAEELLVLAAEAKTAAG